MFGKGKSVGKDRGAAAEQQVDVVGLPWSAVARPEATPESSETISSISSEMTIVGKISCKGVAKIFGRVEGELNASNVLIAEGAQFEGNISAQELTIAGRVKGNIHAVRVRLHGTAVVEGDIFHRSLSIEENARFEGSSRREENPTDTPSSVQVKSPNGGGRGPAAIDDTPQLPPAPILPRS